MSLRMEQEIEIDETPGCAPEVREAASVAGVETGTAQKTQIQSHVEQEAHLNGTLQESHLYYHLRAGECPQVPLRSSMEQESDISDNPKSTPDQCKAASVTVSS